MTKCLACPRPLDCGTGRGLCNKCYVKYGRYVRAGRMTWDQLPQVLRRGKQAVHISSDNIRDIARDVEVAAQQVAALVEDQRVNPATMRVCYTVSELSAINSRLRALADELQRARTR